ncbi:MAG: AAA family ATPase [Gammaproteobacteria bacterium]|nr:AAA family ATPase [Gammaproteobacteria bacterium]MDH5653865.1 AAA family ATPase [Gammaproteobacteria bacterium]
MYLEFYKLKERPFKLTPDIHFFYKSRTQEKALAYLLYGIEQGEGFVAITGGVGYGKTTLIQRLIGEAKKRHVEVNRIAAANINAENILELICASLNLPFENRGRVALFKSLEEYLLKRHKRDIRVLLVIDEAQTLKEEALEELRILSNIEVNGKAALQIFLVGQFELRDTLLLPRFEHLRQRIIASYHIEALSRAEVEKYIQTRLEIAGWNGDPKIEDAVYDFIHDWTGGVPRKINLLCDRFLLLGYIEELHVLGIDEIEQAINDMEKELGHQDRHKNKKPKNVAVAAKLDRKYRQDKKAG